MSQSVHYMSPPFTLQNYHWNQLKAIENKYKNNAKWLQNVCPQYSNFYEILWTTLYVTLKWKLKKKYQEVKLKRDVAFVSC